MRRVPLLSAIDPRAGVLDGSVVGPARGLPKGRPAIGRAPGKVIGCVASALRRSLGNRLQAASP